MAEIIAKYPYEREENHYAYVIFVDSEIIFEDLRSISKKTDEPIKLGNQVINCKVVKGENLETPFSKFIAKTKYKKNTTIRNINILEKMAEE